MFLQHSGGFMKSMADRFRKWYSTNGIVMPSRLP